MTSWALMPRRERRAAPALESACGVASTTVSVRSSQRGRTGGKEAHVLEAVAALDRAGVAVAELAGYSVAHDEDGEGGHDGNAGEHGDKYSWNRGERGGRGEAERRVNAAEC